MKNLIIDFTRPYTIYGNSVAIAKVTASSENKASSLLDAELENNYPELGRSDCHFEENGKYYFSVNN